jgi:hypothetical protein
MISLVVAMVGVCMVSAQSDTIPLVLEQHIALMNVFDGLGETKDDKETNDQQEPFFSLWCRMQLNDMPTIQCHGSMSERCKLAHMLEWQRDEIVIV